MDDDIEQLRKQLVDAAFSACDSMFIPIERSEVENCDTTATLGDLCALLTRKNIRKFKHMVTITFSGYDMDTREVF